MREGYSQYWYTTLHTSLKLHTMDINDLPLSNTPWLPLFESQRTELASVINIGFSDSKFRQVSVLSLKVLYSSFLSFALGTCAFITCTCIIVRFRALWSIHTFPYNRLISMLFIYMHGLISQTLQSCEICSMVGQQSS